MCVALVAFVAALLLAFAFCLTSRAIAAAGSGAIAGEVTSASTRAPLAGIEVCASLKGGGEPPVGPENEEEDSACATSGASGEYTISGLANGEYIVSFGPSFLVSAESTTNYITQFYNDKSSASEADAVSVTGGGTTSGIDAALVEGGRITGRVTDAATGGALEKGIVCAFGANPEEGNCAFTNSSGEYSIAGLTGGEYKVGFAAAEFVVQYYDDKLALTEANPVTVTLGNTVSGIGAALAPEPPAPPANVTPPKVIELKSSPTNGNSLGGFTLGAGAPTPAVGSTLVCEKGTWGGVPTPTYSYKWLRDGTPIAGATEIKYVVQTADAGHTLACEVTAKNSLGEKSATSVGVAVSGGSGEGPGASGSHSTGPAAHVTIASGKLLLSKHKTVRIEIKCREAACRGSVDLIVRVAERRRTGKAGVLGDDMLVVATGSFSLAKGESGTIALRVTASGERLLAHAKRHPLPARLVLFVAGGKVTAKSVRVG
jgi:carboxypeptidase family protein